MTIYEELADSIEERIRKGLILAGQKLPSVRELSLKEEVSPSSVVEAYELLRSRGLIESKNRSGFYVSFIQTARLEIPKKNASFIPTSNDINPDELIRALRLATYNPKIFPFGAASPLPDFFPNKAINRIIHKVLSEEPALISEYRFPPGSPELRDQIVTRYRKFGVKISVESVVTTAGAIEGIGLALKAVTKPGDIVGIESPCYFGIIQLVRSLGLKILEIPIGPDVGLTPSSVRGAISKSAGKLKAIITVSNFSNPLGSLVPNATKEEIVSIASKANVVMIEDDIYGDLYFEGTRPRPYISFDKSDSVIMCGSFAKTISPALRVGYVFSKKYSSEIAFQKSASTSAVSALGEDTLALFLSSDTYEKHLRFLRTSYKTLVAQYSTAILSSFPSGTKISQPQGGFVLWVQLPDGVDSRDVQRMALQRSISVAPGTIFSASDKDYVNFMRMNCAIPWTGQSQKAINSLSLIVSSYLRK